ncbi:MAG: TfoX/Sxy family protein [Parachlamydiales bacterium]
MGNKWKRSSPELVERFYAALADYPDAQMRKMFGYPCAFLNDHLFTGLHEENWIIRLPPEAREELGTPNFQPMGRVMREYVLLPKETQGEAVHQWLAKSIEFVSGLPPKSPPRSGRRVSRAAPR